MAASFAQAYIPCGKVHREDKAVGLFSIIGCMFFNISTYNTVIEIFSHKSSMTVQRSHFYECVALKTNGCTTGGALYFGGDYCSLSGSCFEHCFANYISAFSSDCHIYAESNSSSFSFSPENRKVMGDYSLAEAAPYTLLSTLNFTRNSATNQCATICAVDSGKVVWQFLGIIDNSVEYVHIATWKNCNQTRANFLSACNNSFTYEGFGTTMSTSFQSVTLSESLFFNNRGNLMLFNNYNCSFTVCNCIFGSSGEYISYSSVNFTNCSLSQATNLFFESNCPADMATSFYASSAQALPRSIECLFYIIAALFGMIVTASVIVLFLRKKDRTQKEILTSLMLSDEVEKEFG